MNWCWRGEAGLRPVYLPLTGLMRNCRSLALLARIGSTALTSTKERHRERCRSSTAPRFNCAAVRIRSASRGGVQRRDCRKLALADDGRLLVCLLHCLNPPIILNANSPAGINAPCQNTLARADQALPYLQWLSRRGKRLRYNRRKPALFHQGRPLVNLLHAKLS